jgi:uncharacterized protein HemX
MVDNTLALGVQPYGGVQQQLNPLNMLLAASQLRNSDTQNELQKAQLQAANTEISKRKPRRRTACRRSAYCSGRSACSDLQGKTGRGAKGWYC